MQASLGTHQAAAIGSTARPVSEQNFDKTHPSRCASGRKKGGWILDGPTDLDNLALPCRYHHHNFASRGWACRIDDDTGLPEWIPPPWIDKTQTPMINTGMAARRDATKHKIDFERVA